MNQIIKQINVLILMGSFIGTAHAQKLETAKREYEMAVGQTSSFVVNLKEAKADTYNAFSFSMLIPKGINIEGNPLLTDLLENPFCVTKEGITLPTNLETYESLMFYALGNMDESRIIKTAVASANPLQGTEVDSLMTFAFKADKDIEPNMVYIIKLQSIKLEYEPKGKDVANDVSVSVRVYKLGDADKDEQVTVSDATDVIRYILGQESEEFNVMLADMNNDKVIDVFDVMKLINVILTGKLPEKSQVMSRTAGQRFYEDMKLTLKRDGAILGIPNAQRFTSFQFEVEVPDDIEFSGAKLTGEPTNHIVQFAKIDENHYRVIGLSLDNSLLSDSNGNNLIGMDIPNCRKLRVLNAMFVTPEGKTTYFNDLEVVDGVTDIRNLNSTTDHQFVYDLLGRKVKTENGRLPKGIYIIKNKRVIVK